MRGTPPCRYQNATTIFRLKHTRKDLPSAEFAKNLRTLLEKTTSKTSVQFHDFDVALDALGASNVNVTEWKCD